MSNRSTNPASEVYGQTLRLAAGAHDGAAAYVRLAIVRRRGRLFGWSYNVREARAEWSADTRHEPAALGDGRLLSWRWLDRDAAEAAYARREQTFIALGYGAIEDPTIHRGRWDWLRDLAQRQLAHSPDATHDPCAALQRAFATLDMPAHDRSCGIANVLGIDVTTLLAPTAEVASRADAAALELALDLMQRDGDRELRDAALRWLRLPPTLFQLQPRTLLDWCDRPDIAAIVAPLVPQRGLALLGPHGVQTLADTARDPQLRRSAGAVARRLRAFDC